MTAATTQRQHTKRPGEVVVTAFERILLAAPWLNRGNPMCNWTFALEPGVPTVLPAQALLDADGQVEVLTDASHGVLPALVDAGDTASRALWRDGKLRPAPKSQLIEMLQQKYAVDGSFAGCVQALIEAGWTEDAAVERLTPVYEAAYAEGTARRAPWVETTKTLLEEQKKSTSTGVGPSGH